MSGINDSADYLAVITGVINLALTGNHEICLCHSIMQICFIGDHLKAGK